MEAHQKCEAGNEKLLYYIAQMVRYPYNFENLVYATQLVQAEAIRQSAVVVPAPHTKRRVAAQTLDIVDEFLLYVGAESCAISPRIRYFPDVPQSAQENCLKAALRQTIT